MGFVKNYVDEHFTRARFLSSAKSGACTRYLHRGGWYDTVVDENMIFSHRCAFFEDNCFTNSFHAHEYYEMVVYVKGDVEYLNEDSKILPSPATLIWSAPGQMHTARLRSPCEYERFVLCFLPDFFGDGGAQEAILSFMKRHGGAMHPNERTAAQLLAVLQKAKSAAEAAPAFAPLLLKAHLVEFFALLNLPDTELQEKRAEHSPLAHVKAYIDKEYATIRSTGEIAAHFFYSREHLSRRFCEEFNISVSAYLAERRVRSALPLLAHGSVAQAAYAVGFGSQSAFIAAFKRVMGCLPSVYQARGRT
ncbi:MAG: helix-turn-helix transcriptional regulator [Ruminococcaceae bacterium]|nr:helix-turn-helix transcriptional regulator [Oscillospiraceae bacterium]